MACGTGSASYTEEVVPSEEENYYNNHGNEYDEDNGNDDDTVDDENHEFSNDNHLFDDIKNAIHELFNIRKIWASCFHLAKNMVNNEESEIISEDMVLPSKIESGKHLSKWG